MCVGFVQILHYSVSGTQVAVDVSTPRVPRTSPPGYHADLWKWYQIVYQPTAQKEMPRSLCEPQPIHSKLQCRCQLPGGSQMLLQSPTLSCVPHSKAPSSERFTSQFQKY